MVTVAEIAVEQQNLLKNDLFEACREEWTVSAVQIAVAEASPQNKTNSFFLKYEIGVDAGVKLANEHVDFYCVQC